MSEFKFGIYIPSLQRTVYFGQLTNYMHKNILKFNQNNDMKGMTDYLLYIINQLGGDIDIKSLNKIDIFCILLTIRIVCIAPTLELHMKCDVTGKEYKNTIDLNDVLQMASDLTYTNHNYIDIDSNISIKLTIPHNIYTGKGSMVDVIVDCINFIKIKDREYDLTRFELHERRRLIDILPGNTFMRAVEYANESQAKFDDFIILTDRSPHGNSSDEKIHRLGLYDNSMFDFIKLTYSGHLSTHYQLIYTLTAKIGMDPVYIESITPAEANIYVKFKRDEVERENSARKKSASKNTGMSLPSSMGPQVDNV